MLILKLLLPAMFSPRAFMCMGDDNGDSGSSTEDDSDGRGTSTTQGTGGPASTAYTSDADEIAANPETAAQAQTAYGDDDWSDGIDGVGYGQGGGMSQEEAFQQEQDQNNWAGYTNNQNGTPGAYGTLNNDDTLSGPGRGGASQAARDEYNALSAQGAFGWGNYSYTDLDNTSKTNWGGITHDVFGVLSNPVAQTIGNIVAPGAYNAMTGLAGLANSAIAGRGYANSAAALGQTIGAMTGLGGLAGKAAGGVIGNAMDGNTKGAISTGLNGALGLAGVGLGKEAAQTVGQQLAGHVTGPNSAALAAAATMAAGKAGQSVQNAAVDAFSGALANNMANPTGNNAAVAANDGEGLGGGGSSSGTTDSAVSVAANSPTAVSSGPGITTARAPAANSFFSGGWGNEDTDAATAKKIAQALAERKSEQQQAMGLA